MENTEKIVALLTELNNLENELENLVYGSVEVRTNGNNKYIYVHYREVDKRLKTKYVGEYSIDLYNLILSNTLKVRELKKQIRKVNKELQTLNYIDYQLPERVKLNIDFAKRHLVDTIYNQTVLEGIATTYVETKSILEGGKVNNMTANDIIKIVNLKHAWEFILNKDVIMSPTNFSLLCQINKLIEEGFYYNPGSIRQTLVSIGGTSWKPPLPIESSLKDELNNILDSDLNVIDKAIELLLFVMKKQIFLDGNKRTAVIFANHYLIANAKGLITIPDNLVEQYKELLIAYYEGKDTLKIKEFFKNYGYINI